MKALQQFFSKIRLLDVILFALLVSSILTISNFRFGNGNHTEQLPMIYRAIDDNYLVNDHFVNASEEYGPRWHYSQLVGYFAKFIEIEYVFLILGILSVFLSILVAIFAIQYFFDKSLNTTLLIIVIFLTIKVVNLASTAGILGGNITPGSLISPLLFASLWLGLNKKVVWGVFAACAGAVLHALVGLEIAAIVFALCLTLWLYELMINKIFDKHQGFKLLLSAIIIVITARLLLGSYLDQPKMDDALFIEIMVYFRHPHHYLPSRIPFMEYVEFSFFILGATLAWYSLSKKYDKIKKLGFSLLILNLGVFVLAVGGYVFVEIFPSRLWTTAQTFRLLFIPKYFGLVLIGGHLASVLPYQDETIKFRDFIILLLGLFSPITMGIAEIVVFLKNKINYENRKNALYMISIILVFAINSNRIDFMFFFYLLIAAILIYLHNRIFYYVGLIAIIPILIFHSALPIPNRADVFIDSLFFPNMNYFNSNVNSEMEDIGNYVNQNTPVDSLFLTPPYFGYFRTSANRAIIADWEAIPFQDGAMLGWYNRLLDIYGGKPEAQGHSAIWEMNKKYHRITDIKMQKIAETYNADYAVLLNDTPTEYPVIYKNARYKVIDLTP